jgi:iron complex outermembrane receptor protein
VTANAQWQIGENDITAVVGAQKLNVHNLFDFDITSAPLGRGHVIVDAEDFSGELRFHRATERFDLLVGAYYFRERNTSFVLIAPLDLRIVGGPMFVGQGITSGGHLNTDAYAGFAQLRWNFTPQIYLEAGGRYSYEQKKVADGLTVDTTAYSPTAQIGIPTPRRASASWDSFDPKVTLGYKPSDNLIAFITYSKGFKSGGFNLAGGAPAFDPEKINNIEGGIKFSSDDRRVSINRGVFHYKYSDMQVQRIAADNLTFELVNAASATEGPELFKSFEGTTTPKFMARVALGHRPINGILESLRC